MACVCHSLAACQRHTLSSLAAVIGLSNNDVISLRFYTRCVRCVGRKPRFPCKLAGRMVAYHVGTRHRRLFLLWL